jgi:hypothetical protein
MEQRERTNCSNKAVDIVSRNFNNDRLSRKRQSAAVRLSMIGLAPNWKTATKWSTTEFSDSFQATIFWRT